jgi:hypothetical protein
MQKGSHADSETPAMKTAVMLSEAQRSRSISIASSKLRKVAVEMLRLRCASLSMTVV